MRANAVFFLSTTATSMSILFIPVIAQAMGADNLTIGVIVSMYGLMSLLSMYVFGWVSDNRGRLHLIRWGLLISALTFLLQPLARNGLELIVVRSFCGISIGVFYSSLVMYGVESGKKLGKYTSYESLGWGVGNLVAGIIAIYSRIFILAAAIFFVCFLMSLRLGDVGTKRIRTPLMPFAIIRRNIGVYLPFLLRDTGAYCTWTFFPLYLMALGANDLWIGILYFFNTGVQFFMKQHVDRFDNERLFAWGLAISAIAFYAYVLPTNYIQVIPVQLLIALAWTTLSVGAMGLLTERNHEKATVIGLFSSMRGLAQIIAPLIGGAILQYWGFRELMFFSGTITLVGLLIHLTMRKNSIFIHTLNG
jgi:MFS family permease